MSGRIVYALHRHDFLHVFGAYVRCVLMRARGGKHVRAHVRVLMLEIALSRALESGRRKVCINPTSLPQNPGMRARNSARFLANTFESVSECVHQHARARLCRRPSPILCKLSSIMRSRLAGICAHNACTDGYALLVHRYWCSERGVM
eukprot:6205737-Pleurochrysis_carterae.AAC.3